MRYFLYILAALIITSACGKKPKEIPDDDMHGIIRDLMLVNSYASIKMRGAGLDTLDIYAPVFDKYGYTSKDFKYTLGRQSMKKSSRITEIIDMAISDIKIDNDFYSARKRKREIIDSIAMDRYKDTIYRKDTDSIEVTKIANRSRAEIKIDVKPGRYNVEFGYRVDSLDENYYNSTRYNMIDSAKNATKISSRTLTKGVKKRQSFTIEAAEKDRELVVRLADLNENSKRPYMKFDSIYIIYNEPVTISLKKIDRILMRSDSLLINNVWKKDSSALHIVPPFRVDTTSNSKL